MNWEELDGEARYRIVEMALDGRMRLKDICDEFGVSRQTLSRAMDTVRKAGSAALAPRSPGRKPTPPGETERKQLEERRAQAEKESDRWKTRYEVTRTLLELYRKYDREVAPTVEKKALPERPRRSRRNGCGGSSTSSPRDNSGETR